MPIFISLHCCDSRLNRKDFLFWRGAKNERQCLHVRREKKMCNIVQIMCANARVFVKYHLTFHINDINTGESKKSHQDNTERRHFIVRNWIKLILVAHFSIPFYLLKRNEKIFHWIQCEMPADNENDLDEFAERNLVRKKCRFQFCWPLLWYAATY